MVSQHLKEKLAMGMLLSTADKQEIGSVALQETTKTNIELIKAELNNLVREQYPMWSKFRYDLVVGFDRQGRLGLFPMGSQRAITGCLLSEIADKCDKKVFWLLSAPMRKTSENTVRACYTLTADECKVAVYTGQTRWGAMTNAYLGTIVMNGQPIMDASTWDGYVHLVLTGGDINETGEYATAKEGDILEVKDTSYSVDPSPQFGLVDEREEKAGTKKNLGGSNLLDIASRI